MVFISCFSSDSGHQLAPVDPQDLPCDVPGEGGENTYCYNCGKLLIERSGYRIMANNIKVCACPVCHSKIDGVGLG